MKKCKWFLLLALSLSYFINPYLPIEWGWENSILEWLEVVILAVGFLLNYKWWQKAKLTTTPSNARFLGLGIPLWLIMIGRELSWGRVFYTIGVDPVTGPYFISTNELPYGIFVRPLLAIIIVAWLYMLIRYALYKVPYHLLKEHRFPVSELLITILAFVVADIAEHKLHLPVMEEFDEKLAYLGLLLFTYQMYAALSKESKSIMKDSNNISSRM